jgi:hypothetical protein
LVVADAFDHRFIDCEKWRESFNVDDLAKNFEYTEKEKIFQYYPQYYHKTDKVGAPCVLYGRRLTIPLGWTTCIH